ncbi:MAG: TIGR02466 family protein [Pseudomonadota bacterium]
MQLTRDSLLARTRLVPAFPTPVFTYRLPEADAVNAALMPTILAEEKRYASKGYSNFGGWHSGYSFEDWGGPPLQKILEAAKTLAASATKQRLGEEDAPPPRWQIKCWANVIRRGNANNMHNHVGCYWSGAYYLEAGEAGQSESAGGLLVFHDPRNGAVSLDLARARGGAETHPVVVPETGVLVLFPSWLTHSVTPYLGSGVRISVGVNLAISAAARGLLD